MNAVKCPFKRPHLPPPSCENTGSTDYRAGRGPKLEHNYAGTLILDFNSEK